MSVKIYKKMGLRQGDMAKGLRAKRNLVREDESG